MVWWVAPVDNIKSVQGGNSVNGNNTPAAHL